MIPETAPWPGASLIALTIALSLCPGATGAAAIEDAESRLESRIEAARDAIWWNEEAVVADLDLRREQRAAMDSALAGMLRETLGDDLAAAIRREGQIVRSSLAGRDWEEARRASERLRELRARPARARLELVIDVLSLLDERQWRSFRAEYGHLLTQPWVRLASRPRLSERNPRAPG